MSIKRQTVPLRAELGPLEALPQAVVAHMRDLAPGESIPLHRHRRAQLVYASEGVMTVTTGKAAFVVPPQRAVWMPSGVGHRIDAHGSVAMRTLYVQPSAAPDLPLEVRVLQVSPLLRELMLAAVSLAPHHGPTGPESRLMEVILDQVRALPVAPLSLPMPTERRLRVIVDTLLDNPADPRGLDEWSAVLETSRRTLLRLFLRETGMTFRQWRQQRRLLRALEMLAGGQSVTEIGFDLGYESTSAFIAMFRRALGISPTRYFQ